jgi:ferredoxin
VSGSSPSPGDARVTTDPSRCVGAGQCVLTDPTTFDQSDAGTVTLLRTTVDSVTLIEEAVSLCPGQAIALTTKLDA